MTMDARTEQYLTDLAATLQEAADRLNALVMEQRRGAEDAGWEDARLAEQTRSMVLGEDGCLHDEPSLQQRLVQRGVPVERLTERLAGCDTSERGTVAERQAQDAEVMGDLADARGAANAAEMEGAPEPACPQCADLRQQLSDAHLSTETLRKTVDTLKRQHAGLQRHIQRLVSEPETPS